MSKVDTTQQSYCFFKTPFGPLALLWSVFDNQPKVLRVLLSRPSVSVKYQLSKLFPDAIAATCFEIDTISNDIESFLSGEEIRFSLEIVRMDLCSRFQQKVLRTEHRIPRGTISTYQRIAEQLGKPNAARAVGNALANNPFPIIIPCHRVIRSDGTIGGFGGGVKMKKTLLKMEGVLFNASNHVVIKKFF